MIARFQASVMRSTPLRLTGMLVGLFIASTLLSLGIAYLVIRSSIDEDIHMQMTEEFASYRLIMDQNDLEERISQESAAVSAQTMILSYQPDAGQHLGNIPSSPAISGLTIVSGRDVNAPRVASTYLVDSSRMGQGILTLGFGRQQVTELGEVFWLVFLICPLVTLGFAGLIGFWVARTAQDRVESIRSTLADLTAGHLDARVAMRAGGPDDLAQIGHSVNQMADAQSAAVASLRQISSDIAHDLKTPIQRVSVLMERLETQGSLSDHQQDIVGSARRQTEQISRIFESLLQIAQLEGRSTPDHFIPFDLQKVVASIVEVYDATAEESGHILTLHCTGNGAFMTKGEPNLIGQVVANLIENALRHTPVGSRIEVILQNLGLHVQLTIRDNGPGIPVEERHNVLRRLYRLELSRTSDGNGLGLSLVSAICDLHRAKLQLGDAAPGLAVTILFADGPWVIPPESKGLHR